MKFIIVLFFTLCFSVFVFLTTILYTPDITPLLKSDLVKNNLYHELSSKLGTIDTSNDSSALLGQFIQKKFTSDYLQQKIEKAMSDSDDWITGKSQTPPVISFKDVKDDLNTQYPQLLPTIQQAEEQMKQEEAQNPQVQQNSQAANDLSMMDYLVKSDFTIPLGKYLVGLKNFYSTIRILEPILGIILTLCLFFQYLMNKTWRLRLKWLGIMLLMGSLWGFLLTYSNGVLVSFVTNYLGMSKDHTVQVAMPIVLQLVNHYSNAYSSYQKMASVVTLITSIGCIIGAFVIHNNPISQGKPGKMVKKK